MKVTETALPGVLLLELDERVDERGHLVELFHHERYREHGITAAFVQDNVSSSRPGVLRGLHYQLGQAQGKLVTVLRGAVFDVAVDLRPGSATFGKWIGMTLSAENRRQLWIPPDFAHGFLALEEGAEVIYKCTQLYAPATARAIRWNDPELAIAWPTTAPLLSPVDAAAPFLAAAELP